ncbi:uncharacterized protein [Coffea arabica]|uniref:Uncharacterized protein n=1 Tax=Coffea arabica TaxID=13443 RepID=A0A6P6X9T2_COFAR|nr:protein EMBRYO DEFECTIVE 514-like [Coffea arabica]XP_027121446.1 protein EMBRYO DEFECTIVE 514-like [Coffea arabica]XP_027124517.1 protein EMBRYO DEFECTIVE 514-like [Coffea arabica]XP_027124518.1 protein EMBRYO DEFECTIVE 514-like [Coffea arabica]
MAETEQKQTPETLADGEVKESSTQDMEIAEAQDDDAAVGGAGGLKRVRDEADEEGENSEDVKKLKADDKSVEEERLEKTADAEPKSCSEPEPEPKLGSTPELKSGPVELGPKSFESSVEMFDYFYKFLHFWTPNVNVNKYEHVMLLELIKKGHLEPDKKIGNGIRAFQVRYHPKFKSRCFFLTREDDSVDDFSFRKCVDHILPLPENMQVKHDVNKVLGGGRGGKAGGCGRGGRGHYRGRGGKSRN